MHGYARNRMEEIQLPGVQCRAGDACIDGIIQEIAGKRMADMTHMNPDLMCTAGFQLDFNQTAAVSAVEPGIVRYRAYAVAVETYASGED